MKVLDTMKSKSNNVLAYNLVTKNFFFQIFSVSVFSYTIPLLLHL